MRNPFDSSSMQYMNKENTKLNEIEIIVYTETCSIHISLDKVTHCVETSIPLFGKVSNAVG